MDGAPTRGARFGLFTINAFAMARGRPQRGVVAAGGSGPPQLWAWDRSTGELRQLTALPNGKLAGSISADGEWVYYLDDPDGAEEGMLVRVPWDGGDIEPVHPRLPRGPVLQFASSGSTTAFTLQVDGRYEHRITTSDTCLSRLVAADAFEARVAALADEGRTLVTVRSQPDGNRETVLYDIESGLETESLSEAEVTLLAVTPSPVLEDARFLAETNESGEWRPFLWDRNTDERVPIPVDGLSGDVRPIDWSPDGSTILLLEVAAEPRFHLHDLRTAVRRSLPTPPGAATALPGDVATIFVSPDEVLTLWRDGVHPPVVVSIPLDGGGPSVAIPRPPGR
jgi:Tol biopolymer transport system component